MYPGEGQDRIFRESFHKGKNGKKQPGTNSTARVPKKALTNKKHCNLCKKHGARTPRTVPRIVLDIRKAERRKPISVPERKAVRSPIPQG
jgi:hypothetical protein